MSAPNVIPPVRQEIIKLLKEDKEVRAMISHIAKYENLPLVERQEHFEALTESRIEATLEELRQMRAESERKWQENQEELRQMRAESERKWQEGQNALNKAITALERRVDSSIGSLGARWGLAAESSFRNAMAAILQESFHVEVVNVNEMDPNGEVFGRPDQVELDLIIKDGILIIAEIKSSMSRADVYLFERKVRFYERKHGKKANRMIVISPMVEGKARLVASELGIEVYSYSDDVAL